MIIATILVIVCLMQAIVLRSAFREIRRLEDINTVDWRWIGDQIHSGRVKGMPEHPRHLCRAAGLWGFLSQ